MYSPQLPDTVARQVDLLVVHCSATPSGQWLGGKTPIERGYRTAPAVIDEWHAQRGFRRDAAARNRYNWRLASIGYHYVIDVDGHVWTGRALDEIGAHVAGHNSHSVGICLVGGAERDGRYTSAQWQALGELLGLLVTKLRVPMRKPQLASDQAYLRRGICGHRDLSPDLNGDGVIQPSEFVKTCPGFDVAAYLATGFEPLAQHLITEPARAVAA